MGTGQYHRVRARQRNRGLLLATPPRPCLRNHALDGHAASLFLGHSGGGSSSGFDRLLRYMGSIERQLNRTINQLRQLQADRHRLPSRAREQAVAAGASSTPTPNNYNTESLSDDSTETRSSDSTKPAGQFVSSTLSGPVLVDTRRLAL